MYVVEDVDDAAGNLTDELVRRLVIHRLAEFERVWKVANKVCDRYQGDIGTKLRRL